MSDQEYAIHENITEIAEVTEVTEAVKDAVEEKVAEVTEVTEAVKDAVEEKVAEVTEAVEVKIKNNNCLLLVFRLVKNLFSSKSKTPNPQTNPESV